VRWSEWCGGIAWAIGVSAAREQQQAVRRARGCGLLDGRMKRCYPPRTSPGPGPANRQAGWASSRLKQKQTEFCSAPMNTLISSQSQLRTRCPFPQLLFCLLACSHTSTLIVKMSTRSTHHQDCQTSPSCTQAGSSNFAPPTRSPIEQLGSTLYRQSLKLKRPLRQVGEHRATFS
jgi:hypothetical protein